jgi:hypothetical protein
VLPGRQERNNEKEKKKRAIPETASTCEQKKRQHAFAERLASSSNSNNRGRPLGAKQKRQGGDRAILSASPSGKGRQRSAPPAKKKDDAQ